MGKNKKGEDLNNKTTFTYLSNYKNNPWRIWTKEEDEFILS